MYKLCQHAETALHRPQVWNRERKDDVLLDVHDVALGHTTVMGWNDKDQWIFSTCDQKLAQNRAGLDSAADPAVVGPWTTET